jgi:vancomycin resistance protein YoaR
MAVTSDAARITRTMRVPRPGRAARAFLAGTLLGAVVGLAALIAFGQAYAGRILPGVMFDGVDVGGLTPAEARSALTAAFGDLEQGAVTVRSNGGTLVLSFEDLDRRVDYDGMIAAAAGIGRDGTRFEETLAGLRGLLEPVSLTPVVGYDPARLGAALTAFADRNELRPIDARVLATRSGFSVVRAVDGVRIDTSGVVAEIDAALADPGAPAAIAVSARSVRLAPTTSDADAERARDAADRVAADLPIEAKTKKWTIKARTIRPWISFSGTGEAYAPTIDPTGVKAALKKVAKDVKRNPTEAQFLRDRAGHVFGVTASRLGRALHVAATSSRVVAALEARAAGTEPEPVHIKTRVVAPDLTTEEAARKAPLVVKLGSWTTYYQVSAHNGFAANITVPARKLNGIVVKPGQTFDFWRSLGEVSFRTGYRLGGAIVGGHTVEGRALAGGICAASTTLFNAAARGGLDIVTRSPHWYYITRYPLGLDATVSDSQTMRFRNDTKFPVLIRGKASPGVVTFEIWSVPNGRTVSWTKPRVWNVVRGYDTVRSTSTLPAGARKRIEWPVDGKSVSVTRTVRSESGAVIHRDTFVSHYHRMVGVTLIGR